jgi:endonuclease/exonuclease/phosphatase family metal-dependent hydrolase
MWVTENQTRWAAMAVAALATTLMLQSTRVFISYLIFVADQSQRFWIGAAALAVFLFPVLVVVLIRKLGLPRTITTATGTLIAARLVLQFIDQPVARLVLGGIVIAAWGWLMIAMFSARRHETGIGFILGLGLDVAIRIAFTTLDLPWIPGLEAHLATLLLLAALGFAYSQLGPHDLPGEPELLDALPLLAIGPGLALFHLVTGNLSLAVVKGDLAFPNASLAVAVGIALGMAIVMLRLMALSSNIAGPVVVLRFVLFDMFIGSFALWIYWNSSDLRLLGLVFSITTFIELLSYGLLNGAEIRRAGVRNLTIWFSAGMVSQFALLFIYYSATGTGLIVAVAWIIVGGCAIYNVVRPGIGIAQLAWPSRSLAAPVGVLVVLLAAGVGWQQARWSPAEAEPPVGDEITVMTYNIQSGFSRDNYWDIEAQARVIEAADPDIVMLQEVGRGWMVLGAADQLLWLSERLDMPYVWGPASDDDLWGNAILSRLPVSNEFLVKYDSTENLKRSAVGALVETEVSLVSAIATHLDNPSNAGSARLEQVGQLLPLWDHVTPTIIGGDFNATPDSDVIQLMTDEGLIDAAGALGVETTTSHDDRRIDYIFVSDNFEILSVDVPDTSASDHKPVIATLRLELTE